MGWQPSYRIEARIYGRYILKNLPNAKIAVLYQNDDFGKDYLVGLRQALGDKADKMIVAARPTRPPIRRSIHKSCRCKVPVPIPLVAEIPKFAAQAIRKVYDLSWKPSFFLTNVSASVGSVMKPAGFKKAAGIITAGYLKDPNDPQWQSTKEYKDWLEFMKKYYSRVALPT